jgi:hypothetical protein
VTWPAQNQEAQILNSKQNPDYQMKDNIVGTAWTNRNTNFQTHARENWTKSIDTSTLPVKVTWVQTDNFNTTAVSSTAPDLLRRNYERYNGDSSSSNRGENIERTDSNSKRYNDYRDSSSTSSRFVNHTEENTIKSPASYVDVTAAASEAPVAYESLTDTRVQSDADLARIERQLLMKTLAGLEKTMQLIQIFIMDSKSTPAPTTVQTPAPTPAPTPTPTSALTPVFRPVLTPAPTSVLRFAKTPAITPYPTTATPPSTTSTTTTTTTTTHLPPTTFTPTTTPPSTTPYYTPIPHPDKVRYKSYESQQSNRNMLNRNNFIDEYRESTPTTFSRVESNNNHRENQNSYDPRQSSYTQYTENAASNYGDNRNAQRTYDSSAQYTDNSATQYSDSTVTQYSDGTVTQYSDSTAPTDPGTVVNNIQPNEIANIKNTDSADQRWDQALDFVRKYVSG